MIGFGDFPESVDLDLARQRADRQRAYLRSANRGQGGRIGTERNPSRENERPRYLRIDPIVNMNIPAQARAVSDCETMEKESFGESGGRKRGLSSPEKAVGLGFGKVNGI
jgi:hypothetical protein